MAYKIAVANRKGGVGKTTISTHIAAGIAAGGANVLVIDCDAQGHACLCLGYPKKEPGLWNLIVEDSDFQDVVRVVNTEVYSTEDVPAKGRLFVLPGNERTSIIPMAQKNPNRLAERLEEIDHAFDYIIFDTGPTTTMFDGSVYLATDALLYVTECEHLSFDGLQTGLGQVKEFESQRRAFSMAPNHVLGIVPNKLKENTRNHRDNFIEVTARFGDLVWEPVPARTSLSLATSYGRTIFSYAPTSDAATIMWNLVKKFEEAVQAWAAKTAS